MILPFEELENLLSKKNRLLILTILIPFVLLVLGFELLPMLSIIKDSFKDSINNSLTFENYLSIFSNPFYKQSIKNSIYISFYSSIIAMIIALLGAYSITKLSQKFREKVLILSNMTSNFAGVPLAFAFMIILGYNGVFTILFEKLNIQFLMDFNLYSGIGLIIVYIYFQIPLGILLMYPAYNGIKEEWKEAASMLGASKLAFWRYIGIPILLPSILGTFSLLFANALGAYATAYALTGGNYNLLTVRIASLISGDLFLNPNLASALAVVLFLILLLLTIFSEVMLKMRKVNLYELEKH